MTIETDVQSFAPGDIVELFEFDASGIGGTVYRFVPGEISGAPITWQGNVYSPAPIKAQGFDLSSGGALPRPTVMISNIDKALWTLVLQFRDLKGAKLTRWKTFARYLDGEPAANPSAHFPMDVFYIARKLPSNREVISFELRAGTDLTGKKIPGRVILRDLCSNVYRQWDQTLNAGAGDFIDVNSGGQITCPYVGAGYFDKTGAATTSDKDECSQSLKGCKLRYGDHVKKPFLGFPGVTQGRN